MNVFAGVYFMFTASLAIVIVQMWAILIAGDLTTVGILSAEIFSVLLYLRRWHNYININ